MRRLRAWAWRLAGLVDRGRREREIAAELESHLQMHVDDNLRAGMAPEEARRDALIRLGGVEPTRQACRERSTLPLVEDAAQDLVFAVRQLLKHRGFAGSALLVLALGVGASVALFAFVDAALIRPLPYHEPERLADVTESVALIPRANLSYLDYLDWKRTTRSLSSLDVYNGRRYVLETPSGPELVSGARVSAGFFRTLGVAPALGRDFREGEDAPTAPGTALLSHAAWQARYAGRADVVGQAVNLNGTLHTIVGVLPPGFHFAPVGPAELWASLRASGPCELNRACHNLRGVGRLTDGVPVSQAQAELGGIADRLAEQYPLTNRGQGAAVQPLAEVIVGDVRPVLLLLLGGAGLLQAMACVNVAGLLLVRAQSRGREIALRGAMGASRGRLVRQFATEAVVLAAAGGGLGLTLAAAAMRLLRALVPADMMERLPFLAGAGFSRGVLAFALAVAAGSALLFALTPLARLRLSGLRDELAEGGRGSAGTVWRRLGSKLVMVEIAIAMVLLVGAGLLGRSFQRMLQVDLGFQPERLATVALFPPRARYDTPEKLVPLGREVVSRLSALPGVTSVGIASLLPVSFNGNTDWIRFVGRPYGGEHNEVNQRDVSADYFETVGARLLRGRFFGDEEDASRPRVVVINRALQQLYFPGRDPIGQKIGDLELRPESIKEIVGVVDDIREGALDSDVWPAVYYPFNQSPDIFSVVVRTAGDEEPVLAALRGAVREVDPAIGVTGLSTMADRINNSPAAYLRRSSTRLIGAFAALALLISSVGLYGVVAYSVSQRSREIGIRIALGAERRRVHRLVLGEAARLALGGLGLGLVGSLLGATLIRGLLFATPAWDVPTYAAVAAILLACALAASYLPARRAAGVDPVEALRAE